MDCMDYIVHYMTVSPVCDESETKMIRHIVFSDDTCFQFHGMYGSLRYIYHIPDAYAILSNAPKTTFYNNITTREQRDTASSLFATSLKGYVITSCGVLEPENGKLIAKRICKNETTYAMEHVKNTFCKYRSIVIK